jgi:shikimate kinase
MGNNWILLGMMGSGKSSIGKALAEATERRFLDTDILIENRFGRRISEIFRVYSEEAFRDHETSVLKSLDVTDSVIATGGGIVLREENWCELRRLGTTVFLDVDVGLLRTRLEGARRIRPLLAQDGWFEQLKSLYERRRPLYEQADVRIVLGDMDVPACVECVRKAAERGPAA